METKCYYILRIRYQMCPADSASALFCNRGKDILCLQMQGFLCEYSCLRGNSLMCGCCFSGVCMTVKIYVYIFLWCLIMTDICNCKHLAAGKRKQCTLTVWKLLLFRLGHSLQQPGEPVRRWLQAQCSNAFSQQTFLTRRISYRDCDPLSNISAPQLDPWSFPAQVHFHPLSSLS